MRQVKSSYFNDKGIVQNANLRNYPMLRFGEQPEQYLVDFIESPSMDGPYGARGIGEYGVIGSPACLANSLSNAIEAELTQLPLTPEYIWKTKKVNEPMIAFDFEYYKPETIAEAVETFAIENRKGKKVIYFAGGTEFITLARVNKLNADSNY